MADLNFYEHDPRLDLVNPSQYRMWGDNNKIFVPKGQSITHPYAPEKVDCNVKSYGEIKKGYFNRPVVDFTNSNVDIKRFDRFYLQVWRPDLPEEPDIDWNEDLGITAIQIDYFLKLLTKFDDTESEPYGESFNRVFLNFHEDTKSYISDRLTFDGYDDERITGNFRIIATKDQTQFVNFGNYMYPTNLKTNGYSIFIFVDTFKMTVGNSELDLNNLNNSEYADNVMLDQFIFTLLGGQ